MDCIFCKIVNKEVPTEVLFENEHIAIFNDIDAKAPIHLLVVPKIHIASTSEINNQNAEIIKDIFVNISEYCKKINLKSYRIVNNCGAQAGQTVNHIHFHVLGGRNMKWPPG